ncbi:MAG: glycosyltransferase [Bacteroidota bacterium]|nr:glycosyltransferase [Bacteroidota bacterium]
MTLPISVVLCSYNGSRFIREQVESILQQSYPIHELLISDDASEDDTFQILEELASKDSRIRLIRNQVNQGFTANFQQALCSAKHDWIAIADQDDIWNPGKLSVLLDSWDKSASLIYCDSIRFQERIPVRVNPNNRYRKVSGNDPKKIAVFNTVSGHAMLIKKSLLEKALPFPEGVFYDWWLAIIAMSVSQVQFVPEVLVYQRVHDRNVTASRGPSKKELRKRFRVVLDQHLAYFREIAHLNSPDRAFFEKLYQLWHASMQTRINWKLFFFLCKNRRDIYYYKLRRIGVISQIKHSFLISFRL